MGRFAIRPERAADSTISRIRRCTFGAARRVVVAVDAALAEVTRLMYQARRGPPAGDYLRLNAAYFVGFGAGPEEEMWRTLLRRSRANAAIRLDATKARDFPRRITVPAYMGVMETDLAVHRVRWCPSCLEDGSWSRSRRIVKTTLTFAAHYGWENTSYYRTWWAGDRGQPVFPKLCLLVRHLRRRSLASMQDMAPVEYRQHGLHRKSLSDAFISLC